MYRCVKKQLEKSNKNESTKEKVDQAYEQVSSTNPTVAKDEFELQPNPAYDTSHKVIMDTDPAYEIYNWRENTLNCLTHKQTVTYI